MSDIAIWVIIVGLTAVTVVTRSAFLVLAHSHRHGDLVRNLGNIALLQMAAGMRLIDMALAREVADAYRTFRALQHRLRLNGAERARVEPAEVDAPAAAVRRLWHEVFGVD